MEYILGFDGQKDYQMIAKIKQAHEAAIEKMPKIADIPVFVKLNSRLRSVGGKATFSGHNGIVEINYRIHRDTNCENLESTYLHELAHIVVRQAYGNTVKPHGIEWKNVVVRLGGKAERCHNMDVSDYQNKQKRHSYRCGCQIYQLSTTRHNKNIKHGGKIYRCRKCGQLLVQC